MTDREREADPDELIVSSNGLGNISSLPVTRADRVDMSDDEQDGDPAEDDAGLLHGRSPEFEHLVKPVRKESRDK